MRPPFVILVSMTLISSVGLSDEIAPPKTLLLIGQRPDGHPPATHEYMAGVRLMAKMLGGVDGIRVRTIQADGEWEDGPRLLRSCDGVVLFVSEGAKWIRQDPRRLDAFAQLASRGGGLSALHWSLGTRESANIRVCQSLFGGCHGGPTRKYQVVQAKVQPVSNHPVNHGVAAFDVRDEFYYRIKFIPDVGDSLRPVWQVKIDGELETVAWTWQRAKGGRSFGFTGLHFHDNWQRAEYRRMVMQSVVWTVNRSLPKQGLSVELNQEDFLLPLSD